MTRYLLFAITLIGTGVLHSPVEAAAMRCEDRAANCVGRCANPTGGVNQNKCMRYCDQQVTRCLIRAHWRAARKIGASPPALRSRLARRVLRLEPRP